MTMKKSRKVVTGVEFLFTLGCLFISSVYRSHQRTDGYHQNFKNVGFWKKIIFSACVCIIVFTCWYFCHHQSYFHCHKRLLHQRLSEMKSCSVSFLVQNLHHYTGRSIFCWEYKYRPSGLSQSVTGLGSAVLIYNPLAPFANTTNVRTLVSLCPFLPDNLADHCLVLLISGLGLFTPCSHLLFIYFLSSLWFIDKPLSQIWHYVNK